MPWSSTIGCWDRRRVSRPKLAALFNPVLYPGNRTSLRISQEELAQLVGLPRQRLNKALKRLEKAGLLQTEYGGITALDLDGLRTYGQ
ncbi:MAG: winged helix-turn-helix domain-containing protein [Betaproteobacteria bacterium]|nr:MAG: winged helix-turn-helix domain-containing protein [Betaproteobacteria bacterium]